MGSAYYYMNHEGGKIGRLSNNKMILQDESISREHVEISFDNGKFYIKDAGSSTGTFVKLN